jgi:hypothetical protein
MLVKLTPGGTMGSWYVFNFYLVKKNIIANNAKTTEAREK